MVTNFKEADIKPLAFQMICAVESLHGKGICHRDIKPQNFLFSDHTRNVIKLIDFGLGKSFVHCNELKTVCGSPLYVAPEVIKSIGNGQNVYNEKCDNWSLGVTFYCL